MPRREWHSTRRRSLLRHEIATWQARPHRFNLHLQCRPLHHCAAMVALTKMRYEQTHAHVRAVTSYSSYSSYESTKLTRAMWPTVHVGGRYHEMMSHIGEWERRVNSNGGSTHTGSTRYRGFFVHVHTKTTTATAVGSIMLLLPRAEQDICNTINPKTTRVASERASERTRMRCISECLLMICVYLLSRVITKKFVAMEHAVDGRELLWNLQLCVRSAM